MSAQTGTLILFLGLFILLTTKEANGIIRGSYATNGQFKYQVSLQRNGEHMCGGTIIGDRHVLTAAHCFLDPQFRRYEGSYTVIANEVDLNNVKNPAIRVDVERIYVPSDYKPDPSRRLSMYTGDIAVLKLKTNLGLGQNPSIGKADLPLAGVTYEGVKTIVSGFGYNGFENYTDLQTNQVVEIPMSEKRLRYTTLNMIGNSECQRLYGAVQLSSQHLCGKAVVPGEGSCGGDSGGPLVYKNTIIGVVSSGIAACGDANVPEVYTRVTTYLGFISKAMTDDEAPITYIPA